MAKPLVLILFNDPLLPEEHPDFDSESSIVGIAYTMSDTLKKAGFRTSLLSLKHDPAHLWRVLQTRKPDVVFNLYEGTLQDTESESYVAGVLQWSGIPFTGSPMPALTLARAKHTAKTLLAGAKLPTAPCLVITDEHVPQWTLDFPVIVKPAKQDASVGLDQESVCTNQKKLEQRAHYILQTYGAPVLVEEYIEGREFNVAVLELPKLEYLPPAEIIFPKRRPGYWPILTYAGKWTPGTADYDTTPPKYPAEISTKLASKLGDIAVKAYRVLGCRDYARVDFRMKPNGKCYILEVNPNPEISSHAGFAGCLGSAKIPHEEFIVRLINQALSRRNSPAPTFAPSRVLATEHTDQ